FNAFVDDAVSHARRCDLPLAGKRRVKNSGGGVETRAVVKTRIRLGRQTWTTEVTLTDRAEMGVPMLLGRATMKKRLIVHPSKTFILTADERAEQKRKGRKP
ncbi:MAG: RimK/LysX family protein, partial [Aestuariivirgaceae bacterium]